MPIAPFLGQSRLCSQQNVEDCLTVLAAEFREVRALFTSTQDFKKAAVHVIFGGRRKSVEGFRVDEVAARILEYAGVQVEIAQRTAPGIARAPGGKIFCER